MANGNIQAVTEHALVKTFTPLVVAGLMGIVGWLFATVMDVEKLARIIPYILNTFTWQKRILKAKWKK